MPDEDVSLGIEISGAEAAQRRLAELAERLGSDLPRAANDAERSASRYRDTMGRFLSTAQAVDSALRGNASQYQISAKSLDDLEDHVKTTKEAYAKLGVSMSASLRQFDAQKEAQRIKDAFTTISKSAFSSQDDIARAQKQMTSQLAALQKSATGTGDSFRENLGRALTGTSGFMRDAGQSTGLLGRAITAIASPVGLAAVAFGALATAVKIGTDTMVANAEEIKQLTAVSGLTEAAADNLSDTFAILGQSAGDLGNVMFHMSSELESGGEGLSKLGISMRKASGEMKVEGELFLEVRDRISSLGTASARSAALIDLFGRAGRSLAPIFALSREEFKRWMDEAGAISDWTPEAQRMTEEYIRTQARLSLEFEALWQKVGLKVIPILTALLSTINDLLGASREPIKVNVEANVSGNASGWLTGGKGWLDAIIQGLTYSGIPGATLARVGAGMGQELGKAAADATADAYLAELAKNDEAFGVGLENTTRGVTDTLSRIQVQAAQVAAKAELDAVTRGLDMQAARRREAVAAEQLSQQAATQADLASLQERTDAINRYYRQRWDQIKGVNDADELARRQLQTEWTAALAAVSSQGAAMRTSLAANFSAISNSARLAREQFETLFVPEEAQAARALALAYENMARQLERLGGAAEANALRAMIPTAQERQSIVAFGKAFENVSLELTRLAAAGDPVESKILSLLQQFKQFGPAVQESLRPWAASVVTYQDTVEGLTNVQAAMRAMSEAARTVNLGPMFRELDSFSKLLDKVPGIGGEAKQALLDYARGTLEAADAAKLRASETSKLLSTLQEELALEAEIAAILEKQRAPQIEVAEALRNADIEYAKLQDSIGKTGEELEASNTAWDVFRKRLDELDPSWKAVVEDLAKVREGLKGVKNDLENASAFDNMSAKARLLGDDFDTLGEQVSLLRRMLDQELARTGNIVSARAEEIATALRSKLADQRIYQGVENVFLSITDTFTKMVDAVIAGTFEWKNAFDALRAFLLNFAQVVAHEVFDPILKSWAKVVAGMISPYFGGSGGAQFDFLSFLGGGGSASPGPWASGYVFPGGQNAGGFNISSLFGLAGSLGPVLQLAGALTGSSGLGGFGGALGLGPILKELPLILGDLSSGVNTFTALSRGFQNIGISGVASGLGGILGIVGALTGNEAVSYAGAGVSGVGTALTLGSFVADIVAGTYAATAAGGVGTAGGAGLLGPGGAGLASVAGPALILALPAVFGFFESLGKAEIAWQNVQRQRAGQQYTADVSGRQAAFAAGAIPFDAIKDDLAVLASLAQSMPALVAGEIAAVPEDQRGTEWLAEQDALIDMLSRFRDTMRELNIVAKDFIDLGQGERPVQEGSTQAPVEQMRRYLEIFEPILRQQTDASIEQRIRIAQFGAQLGQLNTIIDSLGLGARAGVSLEEGRFIARFRNLEEDITSMTRDEMIAVARQFVDIVKDELVAAPGKVLGLLNLEELKKENETVEQAAERLGAALAGLGAQMASLDAQVDELRATVTNIPDRLNRARAAIQSEIDAASADLMSAAGPEEMLAASTRIETAIKARYQAELTAVQTVKAVADQANAALVSASQTVLGISGTIQSLGISFAGATQAFSSFVANLPSVTAQIQNLPLVIAAGLVEGRGVAEGVYAGNPANVTAAVQAGLQAMAPIMGNLQGSLAGARGIADPTARLGALQSLAGSVDSLYQSLSSGIADYYNMARSQAQSMYQERLDQINNERQASEAEYRRRLQAIQESGTLQIRQIEDARDAQLEALDAQRESIRAQLDLSRHWTSVAEGIRGTLLQMSISGMAPGGPQAQFDAAMAAFRAAKPEDLARAAQDLLQAAQGVMPRSSTAYEQLYDEVKKVLERAAADAESKVTPEEQLTAELESIDAQMAQLRSTAEAQIRAVQESTEAQTKALDAAYESHMNMLAERERELNKQLQDYLAQLSVDEQNALRGIKDALAPVMQAILDEIVNTSKAVAAQEASAREQLNAITGGLDADSYLSLKARETADQLATLNQNLRGVFKDYVGVKLDSLLASLGFPVVGAIAGEYYTTAGLRMLHEGERVLSPHVAEYSRRTGTLPGGERPGTTAGGGIAVTFAPTVNIYGATDPVGTASEVEKALKRVEDWLRFGRGGIIVEEISRRTKG